jgi:hypothetical protein
VANGPNNGYQNTTAAEKVDKHENVAPHCIPVVSSLGLFQNDPSNVRQNLEKAVWIRTSFSEIFKKSASVSPTDVPAEE